MPTQSITWQDTLIHKFKMSVSVIILGIVFLNCDQAALWMVLSVRPPVTSFSQCSCHPQSFDTDMQRLFYSTWPPSFSSHRGGERRWPQNKTCVVHRYQATVLSSYHNEMFKSFYYWQKCCPYKRSRVKRLKQILPQCRLFRSITPVGSHRWLRNDAQSLK